MKFPRLKTILLTPLVLFALFYAAGVTLYFLDDRTVEPLAESPAPITVAIFGASGTAGDGILKAALASPDIKKIHVMTRRVTPRMAIREQIAEADAVYWAIGISSIGMDEKTYGMIHVDFPMQFVAAWRSVSTKPDISFHYISSSDISADSSAMWAREKVRAEESLFKLAEGTNLRVIAYRPDYIGPTKEEAHLGQKLLYWFFAPVNAAVRAREIGQAMIEVTARGSEFENGDKLLTGKIFRYSEAYDRRHQPNPMN